MGNGNWEAYRLRSIFIVPTVSQHICFNILVDFDVVDNSNLQRQVIHGTSWVGKPKIASAKHRILEINPNCQVDCYETRLPRLRKLLRYGCPLVFSGDGDCLALVEFCTASRPSLHPGLLIRVCRSAERPESA